MIWAAALAAFVSLAVVAGVLLERWDARRAVRTYPQCSVCGRKPDA